MTKFCLPKEIQRLNCDIDKCKRQIECEFPHNSCPARVCHKNYISVSRKKLGDSTTTKMKIVPRCNQLKETCVTERAIVNVSIEKLPSKLSTPTVKSSNLYNRKDIPSSMVDAATEPILPAHKYLRHKNKNKTWGFLLKNGNSSDYRSSESSVSSYPMIYEQVYTKNKGVQCGNFHEKYTKENTPQIRVQALLKTIQKKIKGGYEVKRMLHDLQHEIDKLLMNNQPNVFNLDKSDVLNVLGKNSVPLTKSTYFTLPTSNTIEVELEATCRELENVCTKLKHERDTSIRLAADKSAELIESLVREAEIRRKLEETEIQIKDMTIKLENYAISMKNLNEYVKLLQEENDEIKKCKQQLTHLSGLLRLITQENKNLLSDLQQVTLERNKLQIALTLQEQKLPAPYDIRSVSTSGLMLEGEQLAEVNKQPRGFDPFKEPYIAASSDSLLMVPDSNVSTSSPTMGLVPSICRGNSIDSLRTPSPSSDHLLKVFGEEEETENDYMIFPIQPNFAEEWTPSVLQQTNMDMLEKLKIEIKNIFTEIRQLAQDIPSIPIIDLSIEDNSSEPKSDISNSLLEVQVPNLAS